MVRGYAARQLRNYEAAEEFFRKALQEKPDDAAALNQLAMVLLELGGEDRQKEARELAAAVLEKRDNSADGQATMGWILYRSGEVSKAEEIFRKVVQQRSVGPDALYLAGRAFSDQGRSEDADAVADRLAARISAPGIYVLRPVARQWLEAQVTETGQP